jgi:hypothetical protein
VPDSTAFSLSSSLARVCDIDTMQVAAAACSVSVQYGVRDLVHSTDAAQVAAAEQYVAARCRLLLQDG